MKIDPGSTHWPGCWRDHRHRECMVARVRELEALCTEAADALAYNGLEGEMPETYERLRLHGMGGDL